MKEKSRKEPRHDGQEGAGDSNGGVVGGVPGDLSLGLVTWGGL